MRQFNVMFVNKYGFRLGTLRIAISLPELSQLPQHVRKLGNTAYAESWAQAKIQEINLIVHRQ